MNCSVMKYFLATLMLSCFSNQGFASEQEDIDEKRFRAGILENCALPLGTRTHHHATIAWEHQKLIRKMLNDNRDLFPEVLPDGEVKTANNMGFHWGLAPSVRIAIETCLDYPNRESHILEVGSCYGFDAIALIMKFRLLKITCIEMDAAHTDKMEQLMERVLTQEQRARIKVCIGDILDEEDYGLTSHLERVLIQEQRARIKVCMGDILDEEDYGLTNHLDGVSYDLAIVSKVLHFYDLEDVVKILRHVYYRLKPEGFVVMSNMSNKCHKVVEVASSICGGFMPKPETIIPAMTCRGSLGWMHFFSKESMKELAEQADYEVIKNSYVGTVYHNSAASYSSWLLGAVNAKECILHTVLQKRKQP